MLLEGLQRASCSCRGLPQSPLHTATMPGSIFLPPLQCVADGPAELPQCLAQGKGGQPPAAGSPPPARDPVREKSWGRAVAEGPAGGTSGRSRAPGPAHALLSTPTPHFCSDVCTRASPSLCTWQLPFLSPRAEFYCVEVLADWCTLATRVLKRERFREK